MAVSIINADVFDGLAMLPDESVHCAVCSPPYWGLRSYLPDGHKDKHLEIGQEPTLQEHIAGLVRLFREVKRVLRKDGTLWLNYGDAYCSIGRKKSHSGYGTTGLAGGKAQEHTPLRRENNASDMGLKHKDLMMMPARLAIALCDDGWWLRSEIIWAKANGMPESVQDRPTSSHEKIYLLAKSERYFYNAEAVKERAVGQTAHDLTGSGYSAPGQTPQSGNRPQRARAIDLAQKHGLTEAHFAAIRSAGNSDTGKAQVTQTGFGKNTEEVMRLAAEAKEALGGYYREFLTPDIGRNMRNVWHLPTEPSPIEHYAIMPTAIAERCIKAGCPVGGTVLDPFAGVGTTGIVADRLGRNAILIELSEKHARAAEKRIVQDAPLFAEVTL